jgi:alpha-tubulin suppressor-like RCC1 family protein
MCAVDNGLLYCWGSNADGAVGSAAPDPTPVGTAALVKSSVVVHSVTNHCWAYPCHNGGVCTPTQSSYTCDCSGTGFSGANCTTESDECSLTPGICDQGTCHDLLDGDGYTCTCPDGLIDVNGTGTTCASAETISASLYHTCVLTTAKTLHCWGSNRYGQFGLGTVGTTDYYPNENSQTIRTPLRLRTVPGIVGDVSGWTKLGSAEKHTCATLPTGAGSLEGLYCWGDNSNGQVGIAVPVSDPKTSPLPVLLDNTHTWTSLSVGYSHTCGIAAGELYCWGSSPYGECGNGASTTNPIPFSLSAPIALPSGQSSWVSVTSGGSHTCAITDTQSMYCWGRRNSGQTGIGTTIPGTTDVLTPTKVTLADPQGFTAVQSDLAHTCALVGTTAYCWGTGTTGAIGNGSNTTQTTPTAVTSGGALFSQMSLGMSFSCGLIAVSGSSPQAYTARCWGNNGKNLLLAAAPAPANVNIPTAVNTTREWRVFEVGYSHACAVDNSDGKLYCWGDNGLENGFGVGRLGTVANTLTGVFDLRAVKARAAVHTAP